MLDVFSDNLLLIKSKYICFDEQMPINDVSLNGDFQVHKGLIHILISKLGVIHLNKSNTELQENFACLRVFLWFELCVPGIPLNWVVSYIQFFSLHL